MAMGTPPPQPEHLRQPARAQLLRRRDIAARGDRVPTGPRAVHHNRILSEWHAFGSSLPQSSTGSRARSSGAAATLVSDATHRSLLAQWPRTCAFWPDTLRDLRQGDVTAGTVMHRSPLPRCRADRSAGAADTALVSADNELPVVSKLGSHPGTAVGGRLSQCPSDLGQRADLPLIANA